MIIDEGQQYGTDREIATISLLKQQPLILWTGDAQQTPGGLARAAPNAKRSRQLLLAKKHGLRSNRTYFMPSNLAEAMIKLLEDTANEGLTIVKNILARGEHVLGNMWTSQLTQPAAEDLNTLNTILPGLVAQFRTATHAETILPMAGEIQADLNCHTAGVSDSHAWGLMLLSSSRVSPITYHSVVAVRYPGLCRLMDGRWELGSFASGGIPSRPPGYQFVLWGTNAKINGLVAADMDTLVSHVLESFSTNTGFSDGLFVMTTATDHKNNLNRSTIKKNFPRTLRVETIASMVAQPLTGFLNGRFLPDGSPTEDTEDCLGRITVGLTRSKSLTIIVSPLDMMGLIGMAQVLATLAYGINGLRRGVSTWDWPSFNEDPQQANESQMERWSLNQAPSWAVPPLAIANQYYDSRSKMTKSMRYRLILAKSSDFNWLLQDRHALRDLSAVEEDGRNHWVPQQELPFEEIIVFAYAADHSSRPTYVCLPSGLHNARTGRVLQPTGPYREVTPLPGILFFDAWRVEPTLGLGHSIQPSQCARCT